jgi:hypothetical protein
MQIHSTNVLNKNNSSLITLSEKLCYKFLKVNKYVKQNVFHFSAGKTYVFDNEGLI